MIQKFKNNKYIVFVSYCLFIYISLYAYIDWAGQWTVLSRGINTINHRLFLLELPTAVVIASLLYFSSVLSLTIRFLLPLISLLLSYRLIEIFYDTFKRSPTLSDFQNTLSLADFSLSSQLLLLLLLIIIGLPLVVAMVCFFRQGKNRNLTAVLLASRRRISSVFLLIMLYMSGAVYQVQRFEYNYIPWSDENNIRQNGRLSTFLYLSYEEIKNREKLLDVATVANSGANKLFSGEALIRPNIHFIVLESFIDPRIIKELNLSKDFISQHLLELVKQRLPKNTQPKKSLPKNSLPNISKWPVNLVANPFSLVLSPIYGGGTAQAEFELLSGAPALAKINRIEFNVLRGSRIQGFTYFLKKNNYQLHATIAPSSRFFNSKRAYRSFGFTSPEFLQDEDRYAVLFKNTPIFDGDLLNKNLQDIRRWQAENPSQPVFNYVLGMYGHFPFERDRKQRPDKVRLPNHPEKFERIANQFYYRTVAIANYLSELLERDPEAIVLVISDHLPAILDKDHRYEIDWHSNIALYFEDGVLQDLTGQHYYQIPHRIWGKLSRSQEAQAPSDQQLEEFYFQLLSQGSKSE